MTFMIPIAILYASSISFIFCYRVEDFTEIYEKQDSKEMFRFYSLSDTSDSENLSGSGSILVESILVSSKIQGPYELLVY